MQKCKQTASAPYPKRQAFVYTDLSGLFYVKLTSDGSRASRAAGLREAVGLKIGANFGG